MATTPSVHFLYMSSQTCYRRQVSSFSGLPVHTFSSLSSAGLDQEFCRPPSAGVERDPAPPHPSSVFPSWSVSSCPPLRLYQRFSVTLTQTPWSTNARRRCGLEEIREETHRQLRENRRTFFCHDISGSRQSGLWRNLLLLLKWTRWHQQTVSSPPPPPAAEHVKLTSVFPEMFLSEQL